MAAMNDRKRKAREKLDNLIDAVIEDILAASDSEIIADGNEDYDDVDGVVSRTQHIVKSAIAESGKARMITLNRKSSWQRPHSFLAIPT